MGKLLRALSVVIFLLSIGAFVLGWMLFSKRELLKGRTQKLEKSIIQLGGTIEEREPEADRPSYPERDISECTAESLDSPELSTFWQTYSNALEMADASPLNLGTEDNRRRLMQYYQMDPMTGKKVPDMTGRPRTDGKGTMQELLDELQKKAEAQYFRLNATRQQLVDVREELITTIRDVNQRKRELRDALRKIVELEEIITQLKAEIETLRNTISDLESQIRGLRDQIAELNRAIATRDEQLADANAKIERLEKQIATMGTQQPTTQPGLPGGDGTGQPGESGGGGVIPALPSGQTAGVSQQYSAQPVAPAKIVQAGEKGTVISVNPQWDFVILKFSDEFMAELLGDDLQGPVPAMDMNLKRPGTPEKFITKLRLIQLRRDEKVGVANILKDWQQMPVQQGDVIFF